MSETEWSQTCSVGELLVESVEFNTRVNFCGNFGVIFVWMVVAVIRLLGCDNGADHQRSFDVFFIQIENLFRSIDEIIITSLQAVQKIIINDKHCFELYPFPRLEFSVFLQRIEQHRYQNFVQFVLTHFSDMATMFYWTRT